MHIAGQGLMIRIPVFFVGAAFALYAIIHYFFYGHTILGLGAWAASMVFISTYFFLLPHQQKNPLGLTVIDLRCLYLLLLALSFFYLAFLYELPIQINSDEIAVMVAIRNYATNLSPNIFDLDFHFPRLTFTAFALLSKALGGVNLYTIRLMHALTGLSIIAFSYIFYRQFADHQVALIGALVIGTNHSLLMLSRLALWTNVAALVEIIALTFLVRGYIQKSRPLIFLGGIAAGFTFHTYFPGRVTVIIWFIFLLTSAIFLKEKLPRGLLFKLAGTSLLGFLISASPILIATYQTSAPALHYPRHQLLIFPEARQLQQAWIAAPTQAAGIKRNVISGLTMFNTKQQDLGFIYSNVDHGFVDPLTGVLLWLGIMTVVILLWRQSIQPEGNLLMMIGFFVTWGIITFLTTKNPNYTRLLIILPFLGYFAAWGAMAFANTLRWALHKLWPKLPSLPFLQGALVGCVAVIASWNASIVWDFIKQDINRGHDVGATARYVAAVMHEPYFFYLVSSQVYPYYIWGSEAQWKDHWIGFFKKPQQTVRVLSPENYLSELGHPPFTVFMANALWQVSEPALRKGYPHYIVHRLTPNGHSLAIEVRD